MKIETLKERIEKAEAKIEKKQGTIEKKQKTLQKKMDALQKYNFTWTADFHMKKIEELGFSSQESNDIFWLCCDVKHLNEDIERLPKEIAEIEKTLENYKNQLAGEIEKESMFIKEVPETMKALEQELVTRWDESDKEKRQFLKNKYNELDYYEFVKKFKYSSYEFMKMTDEQIHEANMKDARFFVLDLYIRVKEITGEVTDWKGITLDMGNEFPVLTGKVIGKEGQAFVDTIYAGGYNIQRLHIRTLVKAL